MAVLPFANAQLHHFFAGGALGFVIFTRFYRLLLLLLLHLNLPLLVNYLHDGVTFHLQILRLARLAVAVVLQSVIVSGVHRRLVHLLIHFLVQLGAVLLVYLVYVLIHLLQCLRLKFIHQYSFLNLLAW